MTARWSWADVWPGSRVITLVLDPFEAEEFLDQARAEGRVVGKNVVRGLPAIAMADPAPVETPSKPAQDPVETPPEAPAANVVILPVVRREPLPAPSQACSRPPAAAPVRQETVKRAREFRPAGGSILAATPRDDEPPATIKTLDPGTRALIDAALAEGRVKRCPPMTFALDAANPAGQAWKRSGPASKAGKIAAARAKAKAKKAEDA